MLLRQKKGVRLDLDIRMRPALLAVEKVWDALGPNPVATAGRDGEHGCRSLHYYGLAFDVGTVSRGLSANEAAWAARELKSLLDDRGFDIVLHESHIHIEYDPHPGDVL